MAPRRLPKCPKCMWVSSQHLDWRVDPCSAVPISPHPHRRVYSVRWRTDDPRELPRLPFLLFFFALWMCQPFSGVPALERPGPVVSCSIGPSVADRTRWLCGCSRSGRATPPQTPAPRSCQADATTMRCHELTAARAEYPPERERATQGRSVNHINTHAHHPPPALIILHHPTTSIVDPTSIIRPPHHHHRHRPLLI